ncbi:YrhB domain-containing protein [Hymenobacter terrenus]|uniref:YrhB domain-containing protein n=1 Tax=Hymenobacter terrenus TaxID=1629124 RepID=UPI00061906C4|nr:YrhB domain-containing protein [Hymenobacter terrenus]
MLTKQEARKIALTTLSVIGELPGNDALDLVLIEPLVVESDLAWLFPFNTREYVHTGNVRAMAIGVGPIVVNRETGIAFVAPPMPTKHLLAQYAASNGQPYNWF